MDRILRLTKAVPTTTTIPPQMMSIFFDHWVIPRRNTCFPIDGEWPQLVAKFFQTHYSFPSIKILTTTAFPPQSSELAKGVNETMPALLIT